MVIVELLARQASKATCIDEFAAWRRMSGRQPTSLPQQPTLPPVDQTPAALLSTDGAVGPPSARWVSLSAGPRYLHSRACSAGHMHAPRVWGTNRDRCLRHVAIVIGRDGVRRRTASDKRQPDGLQSSRKEVSTATRSQVHLRFFDLPCRSSSPSPTPPLRVHPCRSFHTSA